MHLSIKNEMEPMQRLNSCPDVKAEIIGHMGIITLDRPNALNALSLDMIRAVSYILETFEDDDTIKSVFMHGGEGRAFCAGGDIQSLYSMGMSYRRGTIPMKVADLYFGEEYLLDLKIYHYSKPIISFMNGITMGGGFGLAGNCKYRIATDKTIFAMPEIAIGLFPDVGSMYHLLKSPHYSGHYLALTGTRLDGAGMIYAGLADKVIPHAMRNKFITALSGQSNAKGIEDIIDTFATVKSGDDISCVLSERKSDIERIFSKKTLEGMFSELTDKNDLWQMQIREKMLRGSPTSLRITWEYLNRAQGLSYDDVIRQDFILGQHFLGGIDLFEGIRAAVMDKNHVPSWGVSTYMDVEDRTIDRYFTPTGHDLRPFEN